jgi:hypothetical protein
MLAVVVAVGLMLNVGCEDSELSRLLGLNKKKDDSVAQPSQQQDNKSVSENEKEITSENSKTTENSDGKESNSGDGTQSGNDASTQNSERMSGAQNNNGGSNQDESLQQTQPDGNTNGQVTIDESQTQVSETVGEFQTPAIQAVDIPQAQAGETPGNNYKVLTIYGTKHPNDLGYAGTWEFVEASVNDNTIQGSPANEFISFLPTGSANFCYVKNSILFVSITFSTVKGLSIVRDEPIIFLNLPSHLLETSHIIVSSQQDINFCIARDNATYSLMIRTSWDEHRILNANAPSTYSINFQVPLRYVAGPQENSINTWRRTR